MKVWDKKTDQEYSTLTWGDYGKTVKNGWLVQGVTIDSGGSDRYYGSPPYGHIYLTTAPSKTTISLIAPRGASVIVTLYDYQTLLLSDTALRIADYGLEDFWTEQELQK